MLSGPMVDVDFVQADISSRSATDAAFSKPWRDPGLQALPLTVFHTAAVIVPSDRSRLVYAFPKRVNVDGTANVLCAARRAGADVLVYTSSASIAIRPVQFWVSPFPFFSLWRSRRKSEERGHGEAWPRHYFQTLDDWDLDRRIRRHSDFFGNYPASKAVAERLVCDANGEGFRTGCLRPANGVYGDPTDNTVGGPIHMQRNHT